jgi:hypothetical protein
VVRDVRKFEFGACYKGVGGKVTQLQKPMFFIHRTYVFHCPVKALCPNLYRSTAFSSATNITYSMEKSPS